MERIGPERLLCTITNQEIQEFLKGFSNPATHNDYHKEIVMLWRFAAEGARDWVAKPLSSREVLSLKDPKREPVILSPDEAARLMTASIDPRVRTVNALVLLAGFGWRRWKKWIGRGSTLPRGKFMCPVRLPKPVSRATR